MGTTGNTFAETKDGDSYVFYPTFLTSIEAIKNTEIRLAMFEAVANYGVYGVLPDFTETDPNGLLDAIFSQIRYAIDEAKAELSQSVTKTGDKDDEKVGKELIELLNNLWAEKKGLMNDREDYEKYVAWIEEKLKQ